MSFDAVDAVNLECDTRPGGQGTRNITTHLLSIERADWSKQLDVFKARDAKI